MKLAKLIVHPENAKTIAQERDSKESLEILQNIEKASLGDDSYIIFDKQDPRKLPKELKRYDAVEIYGARHGFCLTSTDITLTMKGIPHFYASKGYF